MATRNMLSNLAKRAITQNLIVHQHTEINTHASTGTIEKGFNDSKDNFLL